MYTKTKIFNLALNALLLQRQLIDADTDMSNEAKVLRTNWESAYFSALADMDLDSTSTQAVLELIEEDPTDLWSFAYKYPSNCAFFRRLQSGLTVDSRATHIEKRVAIHDDQKVIFTNQVDAVIEYISSGIPISSLSAPAGLAVAQRLASMCAPLVTGKGAKTLMETIEARYVRTKAEAQAQDSRENFVFVDEDVESEFVAARTS